MEHISENLKSSKYSSLKKQSDNLVIIKNQIATETGITPEAVMIKNDTLIIRAKNNYEAVELRMSKNSIESITNIKKIQII